MSAEGQAEPKPSRKNAVESEAGDDPESQREEAKERQDAFVIFSQDKDVRNSESVKLKASAYTGIALRLKSISQQAMENLLHGICLDANGARKEKRENTEEEEDKLPHPVDDDKPGLVNLRFEENFFTRKAAAELSDFLRLKHVLESIGFIGVKFEDTMDFKRILEGIRLNRKLGKLTF